NDNVSCLLGIWNSQTGHVKYLPRGYNSRITALQFSPDGHTLAGAHYHPCIPLCWDLISGEMRPISSAQGTISTLAFSPDGKFLASGDKDRTVVNLLDLGKSQLHATREVGKGVDRVVFSPNGKVLAVATRSRDEKWSPESAALTLWNWSKGDRRPEVL